MQWSRAGDGRIRESFHNKRHGTHQNTENLNCHRPAFPHSRKFIYSHPINSCVIFIHVSSIHTYTLSTGVDKSLEQRTQTQTPHTKLAITKAEMKWQKAKKKNIDIFETMSYQRTQSQSWPLYAYIQCIIHSFPTWCKTEKYDKCMFVCFALKRMRGKRQRQIRLKQKQKDPLWLSLTGASRTAL